MTLKNGDRFGGQFLGYVEGKGLGWRHESVKGKMQVTVAEASRLQLASVNVTNNTSGSARVHFSNGDELSLSLSDLDPEVLTVETWFAGKLKVQREHLSWLIPGGEGGLLYNGPEGIARLGGRFDGCHSWG